VDELIKILHKILHVAAGEDGQRVLHDEIDALAAPADTEAAPEESSDVDVPPAPPEAQEPAQGFGSESAPEVADA
jgi:hypothetical protein